jgi:hypothetical protein
VEDVLGEEVTGEGCEDLPGRALATAVDRTAAPTMAPAAIQRVAFWIRRRPMSREAREPM